MMISCATNTALVAQAQDVVVLSLGSSGYVRGGARPASPEAPGGVEDARNLLDRSSSSKSDDMGDVV